MEVKLTLFSWNIRQGGGKRIHKQLEVISDLQPDVVALQEMTMHNVDQYAALLNDLGLNHVIDTFALSKDPSKLIGPRRYGLLIASKWPFKLSNNFSIPWTERILGVEMDSPFGRIDIYNSHIPPGSSNGWVKIDTLEGIYNELACPSKIPRILCGDFNSPQLETKDGEIITWGQTLHKDGTWRISEKNKRWDEVERNVLKGLGEFDLRDVFSLLFDSGKRDFSFVLKRKDILFHRRFDHCFASKSLNPVAFEYLHNFREEKLSDHSPLVVKFNPEVNAYSDSKQSRIEVWENQKMEGSKVRLDKFTYVEGEFEIKK
ncbi:endonuclease/exonuclease/phosphatase family protein [Guptibacillus hwajinpoensis]|uniref:endonuclease/exonuclease/phosphatase family protein n=1 Tax=Guptibacillus hwajinpoensis TaxID=208199 RepID=UPI00273E06F1|nr:endonuclease/exonuclease/phosphatase family protein [Pseudalkalibacillus hwajinpoensis]WLR61499.1 endonuclease/exonuclease/phosphatase family protein [Pseudalkalibacillus hwajinpoensis]